MISIVLAFALILSCAACVILPYSVRTSVRPSLVAKAADRIFVGISTMEDILLEFGEPEEYVNGDAPVFRYRWARERGVSTAIGSLGGESYRETSYALRIEFDKDAKIRRYEIEEVKGLWTNR